MKNLLVREYRVSNENGIEKKMSLLFPCFRPEQIVFFSLHISIRTQIVNVIETS